MMAMYSAQQQPTHSNIVKKNKVLTEKRIGAHLRAPFPSDVDAERGLGDVVDRISAWHRRGPLLYVVLDEVGGVFDWLGRGLSDSVPHRALRGGAELSWKRNSLENEHCAGASEYWLMLRVRTSVW